MQEPVLADPALLLDQDPMHDGDLPGGAAERERRDARPDAHGLGERNAVLAAGLGTFGRPAFAHVAQGLLPALAEGQLWASPVASRAQRYNAS